MGNNCCESPNSQKQYAPQYYINNKSGSKEKKDINNISSNQNEINKGIAPNNQKTKINNNNNRYEIKSQPIPTYKKFNIIKSIRYSDNITFLLELNNKKLMAGSSNGTMSILNLDNFEIEYSIKEENKILCLLEFEPNMILCGTQSKSINLWNIIQNKKVNSFNKHLLSVNCLVKCNEKYFASASNDKNIIIWDYSQRKYVRTLTGHTNNIFCLIKLNNKSQLCSGSADKTVKIWNWENGECEHTIQHESWVKSLCQLLNDSIISGSDDNTIKKWYDYKIENTFNEHQGSVKCLCNINNKYIASGSFDSTIKIWDLDGNKCVQTLTEHKDKVICLLNHSRGYLVSCSNDKTIKFWKQV